MTDGKAEDIRLEITDLTKMLNEQLGAIADSLSRIHDRLHELVRASDYVANTINRK
jgi:hypothetical protein